jgi:hypothetical protein
MTASFAAARPFRGGATRRGRRHGGGGARTGRRADEGGARTRAARGRGRRGGRAAAAPRQLVRIRNTHDARRLQAIRVAIGFGASAVRAPDLSLRIGSRVAATQLNVGPAEGFTQSVASSFEAVVRGAAVCLAGVADGEFHDAQRVQRARRRGRIRAPRGTARDLPVAKTANCPGARAHLRQLGRVGKGPCGNRSRGPRAATFGPMPNRGLDVVPLPHTADRALSTYQGGAGEIPGRRRPR